MVEHVHCSSVISTYCKRLGIFSDCREAQCAMTKVLSYLVLTCGVAMSRRARSMFVARRLPAAPPLLDKAFVWRNTSISHSQSYYVYHRATMPTRVLRPAHHRRVQNGVYQWRDSRLVTKHENRSRLQRSIKHTFKYLCRFARFGLCRYRKSHDLSHPQ